MVLLTVAIFLELYLLALQFDVENTSTDFSLVPQDNPLESLGFMFGAALAATLIETPVIIISIKGVALWLL